MPADNKYISTTFRANIAGHSCHRVASNMSVHDNQTSRTDARRKHRTDPRSQLGRSKELVCGTRPIQSSVDKRCRKRLHASDVSENVPAKFMHRNGGDSFDRHCTEATEVSTADQHMAVVSELVLPYGVEEKRIPKPKRPAENLTTGSLFDLVSHLDAARKKTRRDFDPDLVTVMHQSNERSCLLHSRPEFNNVETSAGAQVGELGDDDPVHASPLPLCHTDIQSAHRIGSLIAETVDRHIDAKKLEETARSVSQRLHRSATKTAEREVVHRQRPILISTVPRHASTIRDRLPQTSCTPKAAGVHQPVSDLAIKSHQNPLHSPNVRHRLTLVGSGFGNQHRTVGMNSNTFANMQSSDSDACQPERCSAEGPLEGRQFRQHVRSVVVDKSANFRRRPVCLPHDGDSNLPKNNNGCV